MPLKPQTSRVSEPARPLCNAGRYIAEQELTCRRLAISANAGTAASAEWKRLAEVWEEQHAIHAVRCLRCSASNDGKSARGKEK